MLLLLYCHRFPFTRQKCAEKRFQLNANDEQKYCCKHTTQGIKFKRQQSKLLVVLPRGELLQEKIEFNSCNS